MSGADVKGWVYLIVNDQHDPANFHVKIGFTERDPVERARQFVSTGANGTFVVIYQAYVSRPQKVEHAVHRQLASRRRGGEWFEVCPDHAREQIVRASGGVHYEETTPRWHPSQPAPREWTKTVLSEARRATEEKARKQREIEQRTRRIAEEERIRKARADEQLRKQAELAEHRRRAEEAARVAAEAARKEDRKRREAIRAEEARQANERFAQSVLRGCGLIAVALLAGAMLYGVTGPYTEAAIARRRGRVEETAARLQLLDGQRSKKWEEHQLTLQQLEGLSETKTNLERDAELSAEIAATARTALLYAEARLRNFLESPPRVSDRALRDQEQVLRSAVDDRGRKYQDAVSKATDARSRFEQLPSHEMQLGQRAALLKQEASALENQVEQQKRAMQSAERDLSSAIWHNKRWGR